MVNKYKIKANVIVKHDINKIKLSSCLHMLIRKAHSQYPSAEQGLKLCEIKLYVAHLMQKKKSK